ncbi:hypothetical protein GGX14DRAFT_336174, partial [Mycena pura]
MKAFISCLLKYDPSHRNSEGEIFGVVKGYYGCVEAQGRGTLHCHMLVWLEGGLNPDEIKRQVVADPDFKDRLLAYLEDNISNAIPSDPVPNATLPSSLYNPCSVRGVNPAADPSDMVNRQLREKDLHFLAKQCQSHTHSKTCYKYWKGPPEPKDCRVDLDSSNFRPESTVDSETGEICLRCLDGMVNNFNATILEAIRCNMDIKFIGSGTSAKAILYYITDYITKAAQLKAHIAYAALELAVKKLGEFNPDEDELTTRAKCMLQKCAYALISHQELSSQQVASYLMDYEDHFTSHKFVKLFWTKISVLNDENDAAQENSCTPPEEPEEERDWLAPDQGNIDEDCEVSICVDPQGNMHASVSVVGDYQCRGIELDNVCVWDFVARVKKVT